MSSFDAIVMGGGPAGTAAARLLALWGHAVLLLTKPVDRARGLAESLPPDTRTLLDTIGVLEELEQHGFYRTSVNTGGFQVFRPDLDQLLRDSAARAGVQLLDEVGVRQVHLPTEADSGEEVLVDFEQRGLISLAGAPVVLDCTGRAGIIARLGLRRYDAGGRLQAFIGAWDREAGWDLPDETQRLVETYADGWGWSVPVSRSKRQIGTMLDASTTHVTREPTLKDTYLAELEKTSELRRLMEGATLRQVWTCEASTYDASSYAGPGFLLVGDAGSFIDPLSSSGVKKALASAWRAAVAVHTRLIDPSRQAMAWDFFCGRERLAYAADELDETALLRAPEVQAALDTFKQRDTIDLAWADHVRFESEPVIRDREIVLEQAVPLPAVGRALRFLAGVDLLKLGEMAAQHRRVGDLYDAYCRICAPVSQPDFLGAFSLLYAHGALTSRSK
jgi:FADH2-dependent halogenase